MREAGQGYPSLNESTNTQRCNLSSSIPISAVSVPDALSKLKDGEWLVPAFQRDFVWDVPAITSLATSIIDGYPIGMMTLWDQSEDDDVAHLEPISLPDWSAEKGEVVKRTFGAKQSRHPQAILDGRQRCTALAMLFANFRQLDGKRKYAGRFFLDVTAIDPNERIAFYKVKALEKRGLTSDTACIAQGLFPLSPPEGINITEQWLDYIEAIRQKGIYPPDKMPDSDELDRRAQILRSAYKGIFHSTVAVYTVPSDYDLGKICDIFETLNQTGVKVSTVDLIHSWILTETTKEGDPLSVRDWMEEVSSLPGAVGWVSSEKRPELTAQFVTACYVARDLKPEVPRKSKGVTKEIRSVKSPDLLNTPKAHWRQIVTHQDDFSSYLGDFQKVVAGGVFSADKCPYPVSAAIYVALRWHLSKDYPRGNAAWNRPELDALYRAFFWWNSLSGRYDQGFLTQLGADIAFMKKTLMRRAEHDSAASWLTDAQESLQIHMSKDLPSSQRLKETLLNGRPGGALQSAVQLRMIAASRHDIAGVDLEVGKPLEVQLHHIFPTKWCKNNANGRFERILNSKKSEIDYVNSVANMMPLSPATNQAWRDMSPGTFVVSRGITFAPLEKAMRASFITSELFDLMILDLEGVSAFWDTRAELIASSLLELTTARM